MHMAPQKIGILGGGQLARMLAIKCQQLGMQAFVLSASSTDPAAQVTRFWFEGNADDLGTLKSFLEKVDVATFESEFLNADKLRLASQFSKKLLFPNPKTMGQLQNRKTQKILLDECKIKVAPWIFVEQVFQAKEVLASLNSKLVLKTCRYGYDGYGTFVIDRESQLETIFENPVPDGYIAEAKIDFKRELAFMMARDRSGNILSLPLVESLQQDSKCLWVKGPVQHKSFNKLKAQMKKLLKKIDYVGVIGIEIFDCGDDLLVNELAPRVHNSGHYSMDALIQDQFLLHILAVSGFKLPNKITQKSKAFAMYNLIGESWAPEWARHDLFFHWYGKSEARPGRKMGHLNSLSDTPELALKKILKIKRDLSLESK